MLLGLPLSQGAPVLLLSLAYLHIFWTRSFPRCYLLTKVVPQGQVVVDPQSESWSTQGQASPELWHWNHWFRINLEHIKNETHNMHILGRLLAEQPLFWCYSVLFRLENIFGHFFSYFLDILEQNLSSDESLRSSSKNTSSTVIAMLPRFHLPAPFSTNFSYILLNLLFQVSLKSVLPSNKNLSPGDLLLSRPGQMVLVESCQHPTKEPVHRQRGFGMFNDSRPCVLYPCSSGPQSHLKGKS